MATKKKAPPKKATKKAAKKKTTTKRKTTKKKATNKPPATEIEAEETPNEAEEPHPFVADLRVLVDKYPLSELADFLGQTLWAVAYPGMAPAAPEPKKSAKRKKNASKAKGGKKTKRQLVAEARRQKILEYMKGKKDVTKGEVASALPGVDLQAIWRDLSRLTMEGHIEATGNTRNRVYNVIA